MEIDHYLSQLDVFLTSYLEKWLFTSNLISNPIGKLITELLVVLFLIVLSYETIYWSGIYLNLWEYHAKDIFTEIPIHCAHVYFRLNVIDRKDLQKLQEYYNLKKHSKFNILKWNELNLLGSSIFKMNNFVKYHFEFSPEDFEMNKNPEYGSTIIHLRRKILRLFETSQIYKEFQDKKYSENDVLIFNRYDEKIEPSEDSNYLSKCNIETGNIIDCIIIY